MENISSNQDFQNHQLGLNVLSIRMLSKAFKWARMLSIFVMVALGGFIVYTLVMTVATASPGLGETLALFASIGISILFYGLLLYYLWNFSKYGQSAIEQNDAILLSRSLHFLASFFKFIGILSIITFTLAIIILIFSLFFAGLMASI